MLRVGAEMTSANRERLMFTRAPSHLCVGQLLTCCLHRVLYVRANAAWNIFVLAVGQLLEETRPSFIDE